MKRKLLPPVMMCVAGLVTFVITVIRQYSLNARLLAVFLVLLLFYLIGSGIVWFLDYFDRENEKAAQQQDEVIEKDGEETEDTSLPEDSEQSVE